MYKPKIKKAMKKLVIFGFLLAMTPIFLQAQITDTENIVFNAHLLKTFDLTVVTGATQEITFDNAAEYTNGVDEVNGIVPGTSDITVEATGNWFLEIECPDFVPYVGPNGAGTGIIPINNLGMYLEATSATPTANTFTGGQVLTAFEGQANITAMANAAFIIINNGSGNAGAAADNSFTMHWEMGTSNGTMNAASMFDQMALGVFGPGDFTTTAILTLTEIP
jgi:hypothetical protein